MFQLPFEFFVRVSPPIVIRDDKCKLDVKAVSATNISNGTCLLLISCQKNTAISGFLHNEIKVSQLVLGQPTNHQNVYNSLYFDCVVRLWRREGWDRSVV